MRNEKSTDKNHHRDMEVKARESIGDSPITGHRPAYGEAVGGTCETALGICTLARGEAKVDGAEAVQEGAVWGDGKPGEGMTGSHGVLPREAGSHGTSGGDRGVSVDHTPVSEEVRVGPSQRQKAKPFIPERTGHEAQ